MCVCADVELRANETGQTPILIPLHGQNPSYCNTHIQSMYVCEQQMGGPLIYQADITHQTMRSQIHTHIHPPSIYAAEFGSESCIIIYIYICYIMPSGTSPHHQNVATFVKLILIFPIRALRSTCATGTMALVKN